MSGLFKPQTPPTPQVAAAAPMPDPTSPSVIEAQNNAAAAAMARAGRQSTILGKQGGGGSSAAPVAADAYTGSKLGVGG